MSFEVESLRVLAADHCQHLPDGKFFQFQRKSSVLRYVVDCDGHREFPELAKCIKEQSAAYMRLFTIAMAAYENMAVGPHLFPLGSISEYLFISCGFSAVDALASLLVTILTGTPPENEEAIPALGTVYKKVLKDHPVLPLVRNLQQSAWYLKLKEARHRIQHRGYWPLRVHPDGYVLAKAKLSFGGPLEKDWITWEAVDFQSLALGLLYDLEAWELNIIPVLDQFSPFAPVASIVTQGFKADYASLGSFSPDLGLQVTRSPKDNPPVL